MNYKMILNKYTLVLGIILVCTQPCITDVNITKVHLIFMNHLDVGFNGITPQTGFVINVINKYFTKYFPGAIELALQMNFLGYRERLIYTTHPWLVSLYLDCPQNLTMSGIQLMCPTEEQREGFLYAAKRGDITWHAGPMNMQYEALDTAMVNFSLKLSEDMDARMDIKRRHRVLSQRDVPGMTRALIPIFNNHGIEGVTVGVNSVSSPPAVPKIFKWVFQNSSVIAMWHPGGYPIKPGSFPSMPLGLSRDNCVTFEQFDEAMCFSFRGDNQGPPTSIAEVLNSYEIVRGQFPGAIVEGSAFENFVEVVQSVKDKLPVVDQEIGDTWIQGISSDPGKTAMMRGFFRARTACLTSAPNFEDVISSWSEQRQFIDLALETLGDHPLVQAVEEEYKQLVPQAPDLSKYKQLSATTFDCQNGFKFSFAADGSLNKLQDKDGRNWASKSQPIGQLLYKTYNDTDFDSFQKQYVLNHYYWFQVGKWNLTANCPTCESTIWNTKLQKLYAASDGSCDVVALLAMEEDRATSFYGAPPKIYVKYLSSSNTFLSIEVQLFGKKPTRLAESLSLSFQPIRQEGSKWYLHKLGQLIDPLNVVTNGSQRLHAVDEGVQYKDSNGKGMMIGSKDVGLATVHQTPTDVSVLPVPLTPIQSISGVSYNIFNNVWDCNYIFWYPFLKQDSNSKYRFSITFS
ncbi:hypothetical protein LOTGIDRAFT_160458 [Lottia gigantea]|uniref:Glycoside hydrolase family 38 N-terminal domain-containing protein n=1 Tax=Lottia gigantea TaxID=225164 RepID=V4AKV3_LOTGI|nr:hypothetical protein LOTGIDRAFT_160458 [Lottia gigantea]ESO95330.1 hypothetical protein LOTGIDRAFT_160458 [Lottia gigantea]